MLTLKQFTFNHFGVNSYLLYDEESAECAIIDPGMEALYEDAQLFQFIETHHLTPKYILLTHAHIDHVCGLQTVVDRFHLPVSMHDDGRKLLRQSEAYASMMGFDVGRLDGIDSVHIDEGTLLPLGGGAVECRYVPGHCPGSIAFVIPELRVVITGDALFQGSIGRTDLPGGNYVTLIQSVKERLLTLPDDYRVLPGHGEASTILDEKTYNPFLS